MYEITIKKTGDFEIYNTSRKKVVFKGKDKKIAARHGRKYKFKDVRDMLGSMTSWVSLATFKKISNRLCAW
jgi:hypothetical protein